MDISLLQGTLPTNASILPIPAVTTPVGEGFWESAVYEWGTARFLQASVGDDQYILAAFFPILWSQTAGAWCAYVEGSGDPRRFYDFSTGTCIES